VVLLFAAIETKKRCSAVTGVSSSCTKFRSRSSAVVSPVRSILSEPHSSTPATMVAAARSVVGWTPSVDTIAIDNESPHGRTIASKDAAPPKKSYPVVTTTTRPLGWSFCETRRQRTLGYHASPRSGRRRSA
jgi:hypothetical protein